ncbi:nuclear transport factor 2 family protein [Stutzerimonas tarimensis]|uniref:Nuclear transport factor 2 family protein n=1 Tax=Stutzerimonas tarimensis TaxID=1507735 RepID=A0ABV7T937_9GAMM
MNAMSPNAVLEQVEARQALQQLNARFSRAMDRMDRCLMVSLWCDDGEIDWGSHKGSAKPFVIAATTADEALERSFHSVSNEYFEVDGTHAIGEVSVIIVSTLVEEGAKIDRLIGGRYLDRYRQEDGHWKIAKRTFVHDWNMNLPSSANYEEGMFALFLKGKRDKTDPSYQLLGA